MAGMDRRIKLGGVPAVWLAAALLLAIAPVAAVGAGAPERDTLTIGVSTYPPTRITRQVR